MSFLRARIRMGFSISPVATRNLRLNNSFLMSYSNHFPNHIKIDVDGLEAKVIRGARETLRDKRLKSLSVELNDGLPEDRETIESIRSSGMTLLHKKHADMFEGEEFGAVYNYCFVR